MGNRELRDFGLITGFIVVVLFGLLLPWLFDYAYPVWPWVLASVLWLMALLLPKMLGPVYRGWMKFGHIAGWINTRIILSILFYLFFLPTGLFMKLLGKDPMARKLDGNETTYRVRSYVVGKERMRRPF